jgi:hypothetical protein
MIGCCEQTAGTGDPKRETRRANRRRQAALQALAHLRGTSLFDITV